MIEIDRTLQIDRHVQVTNSREGRYLSFGFFEKDCGIELEFLGWTKLVPQPDKPDYIKGVVKPWECEIPVIDLRTLYGKRPTQMTDTTCIVIFEDSEPYKYFFGMVVGDLSNVINIADGTENRMSPLLLSAKRHLLINPAVKN
jgi:purine-binding chemotaxis protein CheW